MESIFNIAIKDLKQITRDRKAFLFLLIMPIAFTFVFGAAFGSSGNKTTDSRLMVGVINHDETSAITSELITLLDNSKVIRLVSEQDEAELSKKVADEDLVAALIIPQGYGESLKTAEPEKINIIANTTASNGLSAKNEIGTLASRLLSSVHTAQVLQPEEEVAFMMVLKNALNRWQNPPVVLTMKEMVITQEELAEEPASNAYAHSSPGMILQFAIAGLLTCAQVIVSERKTRCLQRLLTTATNRTQILLGHYLAIFILIFVQFMILILFGQFVLKLGYFSQPLSTLLIAITASLCISALGLLIGVVAKKEEQAISYSLIFMFVLSGAGGAWVPLELTGKTFQTIGSVTPIAWGMTGFENVLVRGLGLASNWLPALALLGYAIVFFTLAALKFKSE